MFHLLAFVQIDALKMKLVFVFQTLLYDQDFDELNKMNLEYVN